ncbi:MAG: hypothetical protein ACK55Z_23190, partial [bacterium]
YIDRIAIALPFYLSFRPRPFPFAVGFTVVLFAVRYPYLAWLWATVAIKRLYYLSPLHLFGSF